MRPYDAAKRVGDIAISGVALVVSLPIQAAVAVGVAASLGRPILFSQRRPGRDGRPFVMRKFRSMRPVDPSRGWVSDASRLTPFGQLIRKTSLDELPTLWNVLRGDMSLVGPRPLLMAYLDRYTPEQSRRHEVRPGLTGLAQVRGRNDLSWEQKFQSDVEYVDRRSFKLDCEILWRTVGMVLRREGISAEGEATMPEFLGLAEPA